MQLEHEEEYRRRYERRHRGSILGPLPPELKKYEGKTYMEDYRINY